MEQSEPPTSKTGLMNKYESATTNFVFRKRNERIDWKKLASVDVVKLAQDMDFHVLQDNIVHVTFCDIEHEVDETVDHNYIKLFTLAQLIIEYLLHSQEYLANVIQLMEENLKQASEDLEEEKHARAKDQKLIIELRKENKKRKLQLTSQQQYFEAVCKECSQCPHCPKVFVGPSYLQSHVMRRHPEVAKESHGDTEFEEQQNLKILTLERELQEIKEKMKLPGPKFTVEKSVQVFQEEQQNYSNDKDILKSIEEWKKEELTRHQDELTHARNLFKSELKELQEKHEKSENALHELQKKYVKINSSHLESIENSLQHKTLLIEKENDEVAALKEQLKTKLNYMESDIEKKLKRQEREWKSKFKKMAQEHAFEIDKLNLNLKNTIMELNLQQEKSALREKQYEEQINNLVKSQTEEQLKTQSKEQEISSKLQKDILSIHKEKPPPPPPRTYMASRIEKSPLKERNQLVTIKSHRVQKALQSSPGLLDGLRSELDGLLHDKIKSYGISTLPPTGSAIKEASAAAKTERKILNKKYSNFGSIREHFEQLVDKMGKSKLQKQEIDNGSQESENIRKIILSAQVKQRSSPKSSNSLNMSPLASKQDSTIAVPKLVSHPILVKSDNKLGIEDQNVTPKKLSFKTPVQSSIPEVEEDFTDEELSDEESLADFCDVNTKKMLAFQKASEIPPQPSIRKSLLSHKTSKHNEESDNEEDESFDSFDDEFDDDGDDIDNNIEGKNSIVDHYQPIYVRPPTGQLVSRLTQSIERQLKGRHSKPPIGSVDVMPEIKRSFAKQLSVESTKTDENDDSLSSLEDQLKAFESKFESNSIVKELHTDDNITSLYQKTGKIEIEEQDSKKKSKLSLTSWDSDDDISIEEIK